jgi:DNA-binding NarL/FixJ family response regulator
VRFVVADDSSIQRDVVKGAMQAKGHVCVGLAADGSSAIALCSKFQPDVVILDISMAPMSGADAARKIIAAGTVKHVVVASSAAMESVFADLRKIGCKTYSKPYKREDLASKIEALVSHGAA